MLKPAIVCIRIATVLYVLIAALFIVIGSYLELETYLSLTYIIVSLLVAFWCELTIWGLKKTKKWAWISSIVMFAVFLPSAFIIMGIIGLKTVTSEDVKNKFFGIPTAYNGTFTNTKANYSKIENESVDQYIENNPALQRYLKHNKNEDNNL